jgi:hypothetical protein
MSQSVASFVCGVVLLAAVLVRIESLAHGLFWEASHGDDLKRALRDVEVSDWHKLGVDRLFADLGGARVGLFGVASYKLNARRHRHRPRVVRAVVFVVRTVWRFQVFTFLTSCALVVFAYWSDADTAVLRDLLLSGVGALLLGCLLQAAIFFNSFVNTGSYGAVYQNGVKPSTTMSQLAILEMMYFVGALITTYVAAVGSLTFVAERLGGFAAFLPQPATPSGVAATIGNSAYYAARMFVTAGDAMPTTGIAMALSGVIFAVSAAYLLGVLGLLGGLISSTNRLPRVEGLGDPPGQESNQATRNRSDAVQSSRTRQRTTITLSVLGAALTLYWLLTNRSRPPHPKPAREGGEAHRVRADRR